LLGFEKILFVAALCASVAAPGAELASSDGRETLSLSGYATGYAIYDGLGEDGLDLSRHGRLEASAGHDFGGGLSLGATAQLVTYPGRDRTKPFGEAYVFSEGPLGRVEIGRAKNITRKMHISAPDVGPLLVTDTYHFARSILPGGFSFLDSTAIRTDQYANKLNAVSAPVAGFQAAGSYMPGQGGDDFGRAWSANAKYSAGDAFAIALGGAKFQNVDYPGRSQAASREEYSAGMKFYLHGWQLSASGRRVLEHGEYGVGSDEGYSLDYGVAYETGPLKTSLSCYRSSAEGSRAAAGDDRAEFVLLSWRWSLLDGLDILGSAGRMTYRTEDGAAFVGAIAAAGVEIYF
jgi:hypothetical protein